MLTPKENIDRLLRLTVESKASDLHLSAETKPCMRIDGDVGQLMDEAVFSSDDILTILKELMTEVQFNTLKEKNDIDCAYEIKGLSRFRVNGFKTNRGFCAVLRVIPAKVLTLEDLGMGEIFKKLASKPRGLVLVTGQTGSGKSTSLSAMIDFINKSERKHILTIEDPIEFVHENKLSLINQREVHRDTSDFSSALKSALREDPDVILVGELRDLETIRLALTASETGHLVFGTLHTTSATKTIDRIIDVFPSEEKAMIRTMLSESLQAVVSQALIKKVGGGRVAVHEIMVCNSAIRSNIRESKVAQMYSVIQTGAKDGMVTLDQSIKYLLNKNMISKEDAMALAVQPEKL